VADADAKFQVEADEDFFVKSVLGMVDAGEEELQRFGKNVQPSGFQRFVKGMVDAWDKLTGAMEDHTEQQATSLSLDKEAIKAAKEKLKLHRDLHAVKRANELDANGGPGTDAIGPYGGRRGGRGGGNLNWVPSSIATMTKAGSSLYFGGGSSESILSAGSGLAQAGLSAIGASPGWGQLLQVVTGIAMESLEKANLAREAGLRGFQTGGHEGARRATDMSFGRSFSYAEAGNMAHQFGRRAGTAPSALTAGMIGDMELAYGLGGATSNLIASGHRTGARGQNRHYQDETLVASAAASAFEQSLERGRIGEAFEELTRAIDGSTMAVVDVAATAGRQAWIGGMGAQFRGDTAAKRQIEGAMQSMAGGSTPFTKITSLMAGGLGSGAGFASASLAASRGLDNVGGISSEAMMHANFEPYRTSWANADGEGRAMLALIVSQLIGRSHAETYQLMQTYFDKGGPTALDGARKMEGFKKLRSRVPTKLASPRIDRATKERAFAGVGEVVDKALQDAWEFWAGDGVSRNDTDEMSMWRDVGGATAGQMAQYDALDVRARTTSESFMQQYDTGAKGGYGDVRKSKHTGKMYQHKGVDLFFPKGTKVYAPEDGVITRTGKFQTHGKTLENDGECVYLVGQYSGLEYRMFHLEPGSITVSKGQTVTEGTYLGMTKKKDWNRTKSHLHTETWKNGMPMDPQTMTDLERIIKPNTTAGASAGASSSSAGPVSSPGQVDAGGGVTVNVNVNAAHGIDVSQDVAVNKAEAAKAGAGQPHVSTP
jgi:murein DD-endopeptidase MepM/ murein hydrolase activator NlpD